MKTYFDLQATFEGYVAGAVVPNDIDLFVFDCQYTDIVSIDSVPEFVAQSVSSTINGINRPRMEAEAFQASCRLCDDWRCDLASRDNKDLARLEQWQKFQTTLKKAYINDRICFLIDDSSNRIGRSIEQKYADTYEQERFWYGKE